MNLHRVSKKTPHADHRQTLNALHESKLKEFADQRATLPDQEKLLGQLIAQYKSDDPHIDRYDLFERVGKLQKHVQNLRDDSYQCEYLIKAAPYLQKYSEETRKCKDRLDEKMRELNTDSGLSESESEYETEVENVKKVKDITDFIKQEEINNKGKISKEFEHICISNLNCKPTKNSFQIDQEALTCDCGGTRVPMPREAVASCTTCGSQLNYVGDQGPVEYRPEVEILSPFALSLALKSMVHYISRHFVMENTKISGMEKEMITPFLLISC
jgi:hypothetical protein